jgi:hypothetical protein
MDINAIFKSAKKDSVLDLDVDGILNNLNTKNKNYLEDKKISTLLEENKEALSSLNQITEYKLDILCKKLNNYRFVDEIYELHLGKHIRYVKKNDANHEVKVGGIVVDIKFLNNGTHILILNKFISKRPIQYKFDDVLTFQKLSEEEQLILLVQSE